MSKRSKAVDTERLTINNELKRDKTRLREEVDEVRKENKEFREKSIVDARRERDRFKAMANKRTAEVLKLTKENEWLKSDNRTSPFIHRVPIHQQRATPMIFQHAPTVLHRIVLARIRRIIDQGSYPVPG